MRRHWRNHSRSTPVRLPDPDVGRGAAYHPHHRMDGLSHHALMSPPATNSSVSEGNSDDEGYSDDEDAYAMDVDADDRDVAPRKGRGDEGMHAPAGPHAHPPPPPTTLSMKGSAGSSSSSDVSVWSRSASPVRSPTGYSHGYAQGRHGHGHAHAQSEYIYRPSIAAYAISCTDARVSTALRPAFTSNAGCVRDRERSYHARGREREREKHPGYPPR